MVFALLLVFSLQPGGQGDSEVKCKSCTPAAVKSAVAVVHRCHTEPHFSIVEMQTLTSSIG